MAFKLFGSDNFLSDVKKLTKRPKENCHTVKSDIADEYKDVDDINKAIMKGVPVSEVSEEDKKIILKTRYKNSAMKEGKSGGFRSYSIADKEDDKLTLIATYPKKGKRGKSDLTVDEIENALEEYIEQEENNSLTELDIDNDLEPKV